MNHSKALFEKACQFIPGGVNSPVRAFKSVGGDPVFFKRAAGAMLEDVDGNHYIDYVGSWGPLILGHCHPAVNEAVSKALADGVSFGAPTEAEILLAEQVISMVPSIEKIRMVNSGTEATMTAVRLARGYTGRNKIIKFNGCYHGHNDSLLVKAGSGALTLGQPSSPGIPESVSQHTLTADFNDLDTTTALFEHYADDIAAIIVEPVAGNMGFVLPDQGFLSGLRELCNQHQALLIFDEVMTGFRVASGGAQAVYQVKPDLTTLGKIIGGGLPVGAVGGRSDIMDYLSPLGPVYQAGTLSGNPLAMAAGLATLTELKKDGFYEALENKTGLFMQGLQEAADSAGIALKTNFLGGMFGFNFSDAEQIRNYNDVANSDQNRFNRFYHAMLNQGVYLAPSMFEAGFVSNAHRMEDIEKTISIAFQVMKTL